MKQIGIKSLLGLLAVVLLTGCCACRSYQKATRRPLVGTEWQMVQFEGKNVPIETDRFVVRFAADGTFSGRAYSNNLTGRYTAGEGEDHTMKIGPVAMTRMASLAPERETSFVQMLEAVDQYAMDGPMLLLVTNGRLVAAFGAINVAESAEAKK